MKQKKEINFGLQIVIFTIIFMFIALSSAYCEENLSRKGKSEIFVLGQLMGSDSITEAGIKLEIGDAFVGGIGAGYNYSDFLNLNLDLFFGSTDFTGTGFGIPVKIDSNLFGMDVNLDYNILKGSFTPLITGGIGFISFNGDNDVGETDFSYNLGAGFRYDFDRFFIKGIYRLTWTTLEDTDEEMMIDGPGIIIGYVL